MKQAFWSLYFLFIVVLIFFLTSLFVNRAKADFVRVWRPGMVTFVEAGQDIHYIVEEEDAAAYQHQKTNPINVPITREAFQKAIDNMPNVTYVGEHSEVTDKDL